MQAKTAVCLPAKTWPAPAVGLCYARIGMYRVQRAAHGTC